MTSEFVAMNSSNAIQDTSANILQSSGLQVYMHFTRCCLLTHERNLPIRSHTTSKNSQ